VKPDFDELYNEIGPGVYRYLRRLTDSRVQAEDILQETFLKLHVQLSTGATISNARAWLFRVATNLAKDKKRSETRAFLSQEQYYAPPVIDFHLRLENQQIIRRALWQIPPRMRQVLLLFSEGFSYKEIAEITGIEVVYVGVLLQRARAAFKQYYEEHNERQSNRHDQKHSVRG